MKKTMKKAFMMLGLLVLPLAMQAQKFHDVELNEATGPVKSITQDVMGNLQTTLFSEDGKMQREGINGKVKSQTMDMNGQAFTITRTYNEKGAPATESMNFGGNEMVTPYTDYKYDDHGNWISRKGSMMGQEMEQTRTITYYE